MKKYTGFIIWTVAVIAVFVALYTVYNNYSEKRGLQLTTPENAENENNGVSPGGQGEIANGQDGGNAEDEAGSVVPDFTLEDLDGNEVKLSDYKGKIVFLNFWATWCRYCIEEMPDLIDAHNELVKDDEAVILAVNVMESRDVVEDFVKERELPLKVLLDYEGSVAGMFGVDGFPTTFVIDKEGKVYGYQPGKITKDLIMDVADRLK